MLHGAAHENDHQDDQRRTQIPGRSGANLLKINLQRELNFNVLIG